MLSVDTWWAIAVNWSAVCCAARKTTFPNGCVICKLCTWPDALTLRDENWMLRSAMLAPTRSEMINWTCLQCRGSKSAIQSPENLPEEPSRLWLDGCRSASRSSLITPSGELENSSTTRPWYPAKSIRKRFRIWMVLKLKISSSLLPVHVIDVSVRPSSSRSVVPTNFVGSPTQDTPKSIESGATITSDTKGSITTPALKSTTAVLAPSLVLLINSSTYRRDPEV